MENEVIEYPSLPREDSSKNVGDHPVDTRLPKRETNTMTQDKLDYLEESCFFPVGVLVRLPKGDETITYIRQERWPSMRLPSK